MMSISIDTYANLPVITRPMPAISASASGVIARPHELAAEEGGRWMAWGAARDGARTTVTGRQMIILGVLALAIVAGALTLPHALLLAPVAFITLTYLVAGVYKVVTLLH